MADEEVKLYGSWGSPFSRRVEMALKLKGVSYQYIEEDIANKSADLLRLNPVHKKIPVLVHHGKPIAESQIILEYIDETWKSECPLLPEDPYDRAVARFWGRFIDETCALSLWKAACSVGEEREKLTVDGQANLKKLEEHLEGKRFFGGESVGFLDITASLLAFWIIVIQEVAGADLFTEEKFPLLWKWAEELRSCPGIKENLPDKERLSSYMKLRFESMNASN